METPSLETANASGQSSSQSPSSKYPAIDLHIDSFIWNRIFSYDFLKRHKPKSALGFFGGQVDLPRLNDAGFRGAIWAITTNPFRPSSRRAHTLDKNIYSFLELIKNHPEDLKLISSYSDYETAVANKQHAVWLAIQGGNAVGTDLSFLDHIGQEISCVTLVHLTNSTVGTSSTPYPTFQKKGLTGFGHEFIERLNQKRIFVDLAHADRKTFMDTVAAHDSTQPLIVTHTGVSSVYPHWRNIDDEQIKYIAKTGGVIGVLFHAAYLGKGAAGNKVEAVVAHLEHIQKVAGDDFTALGSDWDGMIIPTKGLRDSSEFPNLIQAMEKRNWTTTQIEKTLSQNFLRAYRQLRPD